jgi:hypothetical protein
MTKELHEPDFYRHPLNEIETALEPLEKSWVDFLYGLRGHGRHIRAERRQEMRGAGLRTVHRILDGHRQQFVGGDRLAVWTALIYCINENVPLPYWLGDAILDIHKKVNREPSNLHDLFGLKSKLPAQGKRATALRRDLQWRGELWSAASALMVKPKPAMSKDAAIKKVRDDLHVPYSQRKSREMFDEQERIQSAFFATWEGKKKHHMK